MPLHTVFVIELTIALGLRVTVSVNTEPLPQAVVLGVTVYAAVTEVELVLLSVPVIFVWFVADAPPENPVPVGRVHAYLIPVGIIPFVTSAGVTVNSCAAQMVVVIAFTEATGLTVTVTVNVAPLPHATVEGVTV